MTIAEISNEIKEFSLKRNWKNDNPNELLVALNAEIGELSEHFLWKKKFEKTYLNDEKREIAYEMVDVLFYLLQISNKCGIDDLGMYFEDKIQRLAKKYPVDMDNKDWEKKHQEYRKNGKNRLYE